MLNLSLSSALPTLDNFTRDNAINTPNSPGFEAVGSGLYETIEATTRFFFKSYEEAQHAKDSGLVIRALHQACKRQVMMPASFIRENLKRGDGSTDNVTYQKGGSGRWTCWMTSKSTSTLSASIPAGLCPRHMPTLTATSKAMDGYAWSRLGLFISRRT